MKNRRGIAIELAILTIAITAIFCTIAVTTTLQESKFIKAELKDLDKKCTKLEYEKPAKDACNDKLKWIQNNDLSQNVTNPEFTWSNEEDAQKDTVRIELHIDPSNSNAYRILSWTWLNEEK